MSPIYTNAKHFSAMVFCMLFIFFGFIADGHAFSLSPCLRKLDYNGEVLSGREIKVTNPCNWWFVQPHLKSPVHEHITRFIIAEYRNSRLWVTPTRNKDEHDIASVRFNYMEEKSWEQAGGRSHLTHAIIYGTWWNDDPEMLLWGEGDDFTDGLKKFDAVFGRKLPQYAGSTANCSVDAENHLTYLSHFDRLQFLHFMTDIASGPDVSDTYINKTTTDKALKWIGFAYKVAIGDYKPDTPLTTAMEAEVELPPIKLNACLRGKDTAKIRTLFARIMTKDKYAYRDTITPDVALGSLLHVLQDSFSFAHTCRVTVFEDGQNFAAISKVYNYQEQIADGKKSKHNDLDSYPDWLNHYAKYAAAEIDQRHIYANDPITVGKWIMSAVDMHKDWEEVKLHLESTIFKASNTPFDPRLCIGGSHFLR